MNDNPVLALDENECIQILEKLRWNGIVISPFNEISKVYYCEGKKYKCKETGKYFNVKTNTLFHNSKIGLKKWFEAIWILSMGENEITSVELAKNLQITQKSSWYLLRKIRRHLQGENDSFLSNNSLKLKEANEITETDKLKMTEWLKLLSQK